VVTVKSGLRSDNQILNWLKLGASFGSPFFYDGELIRPRSPSHSSVVLLVLPDCYNRP